MYDLLSRYLGRILLLACLAMAGPWVHASDTGTVAGKDADTGVEYSVTALAPQTFRARLVLPTGKVIQADIDDGAQSVAIKITASHSGDRPGISVDEIQVLRSFAKRLGVDTKIGAGREADILSSLLAWLSEAPPNVPIDVSDND